MGNLMERALFVVGPQDSGKSSCLRSIFKDRRFGGDGKPPKKRKIPEVYNISNERYLYMRLTSPHESGDTPKVFLNKIARKCNFGRWCFAGALQIDAYKNMPDILETIKLFISRFSPERVRVCFLSPDRHSVEYDVNSKINQLHRLNDSQIECLKMDARIEHKNGLLLADFFDFT